MLSLDGGWIRNVGELMRDRCENFSPDVAKATAVFDAALNSFTLAYR